MKVSNKKHWDSIYETKTPEQVSWTQQTPEISLDFIHSLSLDLNASIIDIGGGDSNLVDHLLDEGYKNITILDISAKSLEKAQKRLGSRSNNVKWIVSDMNDYEPTSQFDLWHDRAAFHFQTSDEQIKKYVKTVGKHVSGFLILGTFSEDGPLKCSGLDIKQYSVEQLVSCFEENFVKIQCKNHDHITPFETIQNFTFCCLKRIR
jgi:2-polyprenyl-3-methyl-5-hydroxy-6-metoxy-1,4-benzoquinol methylase